MERTISKMRTYCEGLPKIELHAHLNGSLSPHTLKELGCSDASIDKLIDCKDNLTLDDCFDLFKLVHRVTDNRESVYKATKAVIEDFHRDNCVYLELRTTPRAEEGMSKREYVESIIKAIHENTAGIIVKLLLSIDRRHELKTSYETLELAREFSERFEGVVVGLDLCGNPSEGVFPREVFEEARRCGLRITLHCGEVVNEGEVCEMLEFRPERLGHATFIHPKYRGSEKAWELYVKNPIPIECCLTSNVICRTVGKYEDHHISEWMRCKFPFSISTDDKSVFSTTLSEEYFLAAQHFHLTEDELWNISFQSIDHSFASDEEKLLLKSKLTNWKSSS